MTYLDYSATTKIDKQVLDAFIYASDFYGNPNSVHNMGIKSKELIDESINKICDFFNIKTNEIIFTSGASESNNLVIKGICEVYKIKHIITTKLEHSSILSPISYLSNRINVSFLSLDENGRVDIENLKNLINNEPTLVTIGAVNSELGIRENIEEIGQVLKEYEKVIFHSDITQCIGKSVIDLKNVDLASFSGHKIYAPIGIGGLILKENIKLIPLIHGGKSTSIYRSGTPQTALIYSLGKALELISKNLNNDILYVKKLNEKLINSLSEKVIVNSNSYSVPHIINISIPFLKSDDIQKYFNDNDIYISTKTACSTSSVLSASVFEITKDETLASSSVRISISKYTKEEEIYEFIRVMNNLLGEENENN